MQSISIRKGKRVVAVDPETGALARLFHPNQQQWNDHFAWEEQGLLMVGLTQTRRTTIYALCMNDPAHVNGRRIWIPSGHHPSPD